MGLLRRSRKANAEKNSARAPSAPRQSSRLLKRLPWEIRFLLLAPIYLGLPGTAVAACAIIYCTAAMPDPLKMRNRESAPVVRILARDGSLLSERGGTGSYIPIDFLPQHLIDAVISTEDRRFFEHYGVDFSGLLRAALNNLRLGRMAQGGSTITQQLAKNLFLTRERTMARKVEELVIALWLETRLNKRTILELYLNRVYFGAGAYGIEAAAHRFFDKSAQALSVAESALLAGLLKAPARYSPQTNPVMARARAHQVLARMVEAGALTAEEGEQISRAPIRFSSPAHFGGQTGVEYAVDAVLERLPTLVTDTENDLIVETTIDLSLQRRAQRAVHNIMTGEAHSLEANQAALVLLDTEGAVRSIVGGRSYAESQFDRALKAKRQPGSAFKMFVYLAALESGLTPDSIVQDLPLLGSGWSPRNEGAGYRGDVTLREALAHSMNAAAVRLHMRVGARKTVAVAKRLGIQSELRPDASLALGTSEVTLLELTSAYGVLANGGRSLEPHIIRRVRTTTGRLLYERKPAPTEILVAPATASALTDMLRTTVASGTGRRAALADHACAGKTGTSQDFRDAWFVGYTGQLVAGVWIGNDDGRPMRKVVGGSLPARLWHDVMSAALDGAVSQTPPAGVAPGPSRQLGSVGTPSVSGVALPALPMMPIDPEFFARALEMPSAAQSAMASPRMDRSLPN